MHTVLNKRQEHRSVGSPHRRANKKTPSSIRQKERWRSLFSWRSCSRPRANAPACMAWARQRLVGVRTVDDGCQVPVQEPDITSMPCLWLPAGEAKTRGVRAQLCVRDKSNRPQLRQKPKQWLPFLLLLQNQIARPRYHPSIPTQHVYSTA